MEGHLPNHHLPPPSHAGECAYTVCFFDPPDFELLTQASRQAELGQLNYVLQFLQRLPRERSSSRSLSHDALEHGAAGGGQSGGGSGPGVE